MADGKAADGTHLGFTTYSTEDGTKVQTVFGDFGSASKAVQELERQVKSAAKIISRGPVTDRAGAVGQRIEVMMLPGMESGHSEFGIMWTDGAYYHQITSRCREAVLGLEKKLKR